MKLYEIHEQMRLKVDEAFYEAEENEGVISEELSSQLDSIEMAMHDKIVNVGCFIKGLKAESKAIKDEASVLTARSRAIENKSEWLKEYLKSFVKEGEKITDPKLVISWRKSVKTIVSDVSLLDEKYLKVVTSPVLTDIKKDIQSGIVVEGASLQKSLNMQIK